jgi:hypothetical protein
MHTTKRGKATAGRMFRRFRAQFKKDAKLKEMTGAERVLIDQAAILALRVRQIRDDILAGEKIDGDDLVRVANACIRSMGALQTTTRLRGDVAAQVMPAPTGPTSDLDPIEILLREREREEANG